MTMAPAACQSLHELEGLCEYCGEVCDSTQDELNAIACTFEGCPSPTIYHQHCIETYLKTIRLDKQRKTGFQCPRGCGKGSKSDKPCPGRVTKSHPIHARNDSSKKRRKAKMPEIALPTVTPTIPAKEKEDKPQQLNASNSAKVENKDTVPKPLVLNRASTLPTLSGNKGVSNQSVSASGSSSNTSSAVVKGLSKESTAAAIAAARSEIAASKRGSSVKINTENYLSGRSDYSASSFDSRSAQNSESDDDSSRQLVVAKDLRKVLPVGRGVEVAPVVNAWARGRCNELLKQTDIKMPTPHLTSLNPSQDTNLPTSSTSIPRPPVVRQPTSVERVGVGLGEEDDSEARRLKARTKNEKKHLQRAAKAREKREAEEAAAALAATSAATTAMQNESQFKQSDSGTITWSESFAGVLRQRKFMDLAKQLQEYGFADWQSILAVRICGSDVEQCLDWLLRNGSSMQTDMTVHGEKKMDIMSELDVLKEVMRSECFSQEQVEVAVISTDGDVAAALNVLRSSSSYWNSSRESSQGTFNNLVSPHHSFGQASSQSSSDLATGVWDGMLNGTADGQDFSPLSGSANGSDSQKSFGPFASGFISDLARYNSLLGIDDSHHASGNTRAGGGSYSVENQGPTQLAYTTRRNVDYSETPSGGLQSHLQNSYELTASTVTSVAAAVLNDTFGFDEQMISRMTDVIEAPFDSTVDAVPSLNGIWSYPSSTFTSFATTKKVVTNISSTNSVPFMLFNRTLDGQSFFNSPFGEGPTAAYSDSTRRAPLKNGYSHASPFGASLWEQQPVKLVDEAEEQELLMSELLSHLLV